MKLQLHPKLIFRTPKFSYNAHLNDVWEDLKQAISISSDSFYQTIKDISANDLDNQPAKIKFTIWKYFNRSKFRATPYGSFGGFSLLHNLENRTDDKLLISNVFKHNEFIDWPEKNSIHFNFKEIATDQLILFCNSSYYNIGNSIRYIACDEGQFELAEIELTDFILNILEACSLKISLADLKIKLNIAADEDESFIEFLEELHSIQLLFNDKDVNILGDDYFKRLNISSLNRQKYIIAEREVISGQLDFGQLKHLPSLINLLSKIVPAVENKALNNFINRFKIKFEQREIPLLYALDPEIGVGYEQLEQAGEGDDFVTQFINKAPKTDEKGISLALKSLLKNQVQEAKIIALEELKLDDHTFESVKLPNSFSVMLSMVDELVQINQIGGITANALNGRFTIANNDVLNYCKELAEIEKLANPEVLFFDVAYMIEANVDNINRRNQIYDRQLSILNYDCSQEPITLNDIMISVNGTEVILRSKKHNKRLIPKIASAYNYGRSDLSIFRLLCDLQHQNLKSNLSFSIDKILPQQTFYPRVQFKNIIISPSKWLISKTELNKFNINSVESCRAFLTKNGVSNYFKTGLSDQTLVFNISNDLDLDSFVKYFNGKDELWLEEVLLPKEANVIDEFSNPYLAEFVLSVYHNEKIYKGKVLQNEINPNNLQTTFLPGTEWLYFEIFCHEQRSDSVLGNNIFSFITDNSDKIESWFFIRYNENGAHLRLRILLKDLNDTQFLMSSLSNYLEEEITTGLVSEIIIKTYKREAERYGYDLMEDAERVFNADSVYNLSIIQNNIDLNGKYNLCGIVAKALISNKVFSLDVLKTGVYAISESFNKEHHLDASDFKKLNAQYQLYKTIQAPILEDILQHHFNVYVNSLTNLLLKCPADRRLKLFSNMLHMHANRIFNKDQRAHEMIMYYYLLKDINKMQALDKL